MPFCVSRGFMSIELKHYPWCYDIGYGGLRCATQYQADSSSVMNTIGHETLWVARIASHEVMMKTLVHPT